MGRPKKENSKKNQFSIRFDDETLDILDEYCDEKNITRPEGIRQAVRKLKS